MVCLVSPEVKKPAAPLLTQIHEALQDGRLNTGVTGGFHLGATRCASPFYSCHAYSWPPDKGHVHERTRGSQSQLAGRFFFLAKFRRISLLYSAPGLGTSSIGARFQCFSVLRGNSSLQRPSKSLKYIMSIMSSSP